MPVSELEKKADKSISTASVPNSTDKGISSNKLNPVQNVNLIFDDSYGGVSRKNQRAGAI